MWASCISARDLFFELTAQGICEQEVKKIVLQRFEEYFPKSSEVRLYFKTVDGRRPKPSEIEKGIPNG